MNQRNLVFQCNLNMKPQQGSSVVDTGLGGERFGAQLDLLCSFTDDLEASL